MENYVQYLQRHIPLLKHMDIQVGETTQEWFELVAPLAPNINDKQTAFGGSLATLCTLSAWCVAASISERPPTETDIAIVSSRIRYRLPIVSEMIYARAYFPDLATGEETAKLLGSKGRATLNIIVKIMQSNKVAVRFTGNYHIKMRTR